MAEQNFQPAQQFQPAQTGGFGLQMPQIGFQGLGQPAFQPQPLQFQPPQLGGFQTGFDSQQMYQQPAAEPTTFTIGIPGGFQFAADPSQIQSQPVSPYAAGGNREMSQGLRTRDAGLATKKPKKKSCLCC